MRCRLFRDRACVPALCQRNVELTCGAKRRQVQFCVGKLLTANLMRRYVLEHVPHLASWRTPWLRRALILLPGRLARSGRGTTLHVPAYSQLARWLN
jgi:hypothetical protein